MLQALVHLKRLDEDRLLVNVKLCLLADGFCTEPLLSQPTTRPGLLDPGMLWPAKQIQQAQLITLQRTVEVSGT
jgi:hypothetical protein